MAVGRDEADRQIPADVPNEAMAVGRDEADQQAQGAGVQTEVHDKPEESRYEITADGRLAGFARYVRTGRRTIFVHTEVLPEFEGKGIGSALAAAALDDVRASGRTVVPLCPFIASYIEHHPEHDGIVDHPLLDSLVKDE
jgi:predicted GNAT family acetyltransferase